VAFAADEKPLLKTQAQFKLFTLIDMLQKLSLEAQRRRAS